LVTWRRDPPSVSWGSQSGTEVALGAGDGVGEGVVVRLVLFFLILLLLLGLRLGAAGFF
jgi:hypothetical protein